MKRWRSEAEAEKRQLLGGAKKGVIKKTVPPAPSAAAEPAVRPHVVFDFETCGDKRRDGVRRQFLRALGAAGNKVRVFNDDGALFVHCVWVHVFVYVRLSMCF